jgi:hypothetical protein
MWSCLSVRVPVWAPLPVSTIFVKETFTKYCRTIPVSIKLEQKYPRVYTRIYMHFFMHIYPDLLVYLHALTQSQNGGEWSPSRPVAFLMETIG